MGSFESTQAPTRWKHYCFDSLQIVKTKEIQHLGALKVGETSIVIPTPDAFGHGPFPLFPPLLELPWTTTPGWIGVSAKLPTVNLGHVSACQS
ncbi:hypothetical protein M404DRAFT_940627 [Pisolithus tinctorius Marx 270]|uniref:Uncharacterized protein n=1 Tax=Pisolithus tinctorius Marx 270 TaxID=870435 RepID=A0A0C3JFD0_PISTI|nr:hypothetical protein M404DRAFT_940627 [Pisolithus tinctorius Marx 270]